MRLFGWSDLHTDYPANFELIAGLSDLDYRDDVLLVAGDLSSDADELMRTLGVLQRKFREVSYVPGNHDLWVSPDSTLNSLDKLHELHAACLGQGIRVEPFDVTLAGGPVRIFPLRSWYLKPQEGDGSLFIEKPGEDPTLRIWADNYRIKWPALAEGKTPAAHLLALNKMPPPAGQAPRSTISFSHFLPRVELVFGDWEKFLAGGDVGGNDRNPEFNFTRVAGSRQLDELLRQLGSTLHLYGHQHRNRDRVIDGVRYVSHCLGYPPEWADYGTRPPRHLPLELTPAPPVCG